MRLVAGGSQALNASVAVALPGAPPQAEFSAAWATARPCQLNVALDPWTPTLVYCQGMPLAPTQRLLIQLAAPAAVDAAAEAAWAALFGNASLAAEAAAAQLPAAAQATLCELSLLGLPAVLSA